MSDQSNSSTEGRAAELLVPASAENPTYKDGVAGVEPGLFDLPPAPILSQAQVDKLAAMEGDITVVGLPGPLPALGDLIQQHMAKQRAEPPATDLGHLDFGHQILAAEAARTAAPAQKLCLDHAMKRCSCYTRMAAAPAQGEPLPAEPPATDDLVLRLRQLWLPLPVNHESITTLMDATARIERQAREIAALREELHNAKVDRNTYDAAHKQQAAETQAGKGALRVARRKP